MRDDQRIRMLAIAAVTVGLVTRLVLTGNGNVTVVGYSVTPYAIYLAAVVLLALPETIEMLPFGPSRGG